MAGGKLIIATLVLSGFAWFAQNYNPLRGPSGGGDRTRTDDPLLAKQVLSQLSYTPDKENSAIQVPHLVGLGRFELPTSRLSGVRSNRLSYRPERYCSCQIEIEMPADPGGYKERDAKAAPTQRRVVL